MMQSNSDDIEQNGEITRTITLHEAAATGNYAKITSLIMEDADLLAYDSNGKLPIDLAKEFVLTQINNQRPRYSHYHQNYLVRKEANSLITVSPQDIEEENPLLFLIVLDRYTEKSKQEIVDTFFNAATLGNLNQLKEIYDCHIKDGRWLNINIQKDGWTVLGHAMANKHLDCANWLKTKGAIAQIKVKKLGTTKNDLLTMLVKQELNKDSKLAQQITASNEKAEQLYKAAQNNNLLTVVKLFNEKKAAHVISKTGLAPLHIVAQNGHDRCVKFFLHNGVNIDDSDENGLTALHHAIKANRQTVFDLLLKERANINAKTYAGDVALHFAIHSNNSYYLNTLLQYNADLSIRNEQEQNPLDLATQLKKTAYCNIIRNKITEEVKQVTTITPTVPDIDELVKIINKTDSDSNIKKPNNKKHKKHKKKSTNRTSATNTTTSQNTEHEQLIKTVLNPSKNDTKVTSHHDTAYILGKLNHGTSCLTNNSITTACRPATELQYLATESYGFTMQSLPEPVRAILNFLNSISADNESFKRFFITGGAVRTFVYNHLHKKNLLPRDYDLATTLPLTNLKNLIPQIFPHIQFNYSDNSNQCLEFTLDGIKIDIVHINTETYDNDLTTTLYHNAKERDAYINAMFFDPFSNELFYLPEAMTDITNKALTMTKDLSITLKNQSGLLFRLLRIAASLELNFPALEQNGWQETFADNIRDPSFSFKKYHQELLNLFEVFIAKHASNKTGGIIALLALLNKYKLNVSLAGLQDRYLGKSLKQVEPPAVDIFTAANTGNIIELQKAFVNNVNLNVKNLQNEAPLSLAVKAGHVECCCYLLMLGACVETTLDTLTASQAPTSRPIKSFNL